MGFEDSRIAFKPGLYLYRNVDAFIPSYRGLSKKSFITNESREPYHYFFLMENKRISSLQRKPHHFLRDSLSDPELWKTTKIFIESNFINATENTHVSDQKNGLKSNCNKNSEKHTRDLFASKIYEKKLDYVGAGLGDIMSSEEKYFVSRNRFTHNASRNDDEKSGIYLNKEKSNGNESFSSLEQIANQPTRSGLVTTVGGMLQSQFGSKIRNLSAMDRIALTANGNLQRIFSSYYDAPVHVHVVRCEPQGGGSETLERKHMIWERTVHLSVHDKIFCKAESQITVRSASCVEKVKSGEIGIGQLFRYLNKLPTFELLDAGSTVNNGMWRLYELNCDELTCKIFEEFSPNAWTIS